MWNRPGTLGMIHGDSGPLEMKQRLDDRTESFLNSLPFFKGLNPDDFQFLLGKSVVKDYTKSNGIFSVGDLATRFFIIMSGWIKLYRSTLEGEESVLAIFTRGDVFGEAAIFEGATYPFSAEVAENARLMEIPGNFLRDRAKMNPDIMNRIMASMSREMHKLQMENEHLSIMTAPQRVGCLMLQLSSGMMGKGGTFTFPYDKSLAAARLGMKAETFSRTLSQLKPYGVSVRGAEIQIDNFECLVNYVCGHCSSQDGECRGSRGIKRSAACGGCHGC